MLEDAVHRPWARLFVCLLGQLLVAVSMRCFLVPLGLYAGGLMGLCQLLRTVLRPWFPAALSRLDWAGLLYFLCNLPLLFYARRMLGSVFLGKTLVCTAAYSLFYSLFPTPAAPLVAEPLTNCLLGGILTGIGSGLVLTCGGSSGGLDIIGLCLSKRGSPFTVGRFSLLFNGALYAACLLLFPLEIVLYSLVYSFAALLMLDKAHQQNISVQALIFTRADEAALGQAILGQMQRGATWWEGTGAYTGEGVHILCVCLSKYELEELFRLVHRLDPHAFVTLQEGVRISGNFLKKFD